MEHVSGSTKPMPPGRPAAPGPARAGPSEPPEAGRASASATWWGGPTRAARPGDRLSGLAQALVGEAILRHVAGRRVLDLGLGSPEIAQWARQVAASLEGVDLRLALTDAGELRLPQQDGRYDVVYSVRTLAHLGRDEASSERAVRNVLAEAARVTAVGGVVIVDINNPRSLRGLVHGIRKPITVAITVVSRGAVTDEQQRVVRYDSVARLLELAPPGLELAAVYGIRVLVPIAAALRIPLLGRMLAAGEWWARDSFLRGFGAHLLVALRKTGPGPGASAPA
jgi:SAM-dependent methyltransferase